MKKRSFTAVFVAFTLSVCMFFSGCGGTSAVLMKPPTLQNMQTFITVVNGIETPITVQSGVYIRSALLVYDELTDAEKADAAVVECKTALDGYKASYDLAEAAAKAEAERVAEQKRAAAFIQAVSDLPKTPSFTDRAAVTSAYALYAALNANSKADTSVVAAYTKLVAADEQVAISEKAEHDRAVKEAAEAFIAGVDGIEEVTLESADAIDDLLYDYDGFDDDVKAYAGVAEAKAKLDEAAEQYGLLRDQKDVEDFLSYAEGLQEGSVTLESESDIIKAERLYRNMSDAAKSADGVAEAYKTLQAARACFDVLFAAAERVKADAFIAAVQNIPDDTSALDITWFDVLDVAGKAYSDLAYETRSLTDVVLAFEKYNTAQTAFDAKGYRQIPLGNALLQFSGDVPPFLVMPGHRDMSGALCEFYGAAKLAELAGKVKMYLNVYTYADGDYRYIGRAELDVTLLSSNIIHSDRVKDAMRELAKTSDQVTSGGVYAFSVNFEDAEGKYIPSGKTNIVFDAGKPYTW